MSVEKVEAAGAKESRVVVSSPSSAHHSDPVASWSEIMDYLRERRDAEQEEMDAREVRRIKMIKKRRKLMHSFFFASNLKIW